MTTRLLLLDLCVAALGFVGIVYLSATSVGILDYVLSVMLCAYAIGSALGNILVAREIAAIDRVLPKN